MNTPLRQHPSPKKTPTAAPITLLTLTSYLRLTHPLGNHPFNLGLLVLTPIDLGQLVPYHQNIPFKTRELVLSSHLETLLTPGLDNTRLFMSLTAGAGTRCMSLLSSSPSLGSFPHYYNTGFKCASLFNVRP